MKKKIVGLTAIFIFIIAPFIWAEKTIDPKKTLASLQKELGVFKKLNNKRGAAKTLNSIGDIHWGKNQYDKALEFYLEALRIEEELGSKKEMAVVLNNLGNVYRFLNNSQKALEHHLKALKIREELADKKEIADSLINTGIIYLQLREPGKALEYHLKALKTSEEIGDKINVSDTLSLIGMSYQVREDYLQALGYFNRALKTAREINHKKGMAYNTWWIAKVYEDMKDYPRALENLHKAVKIGEKTGYRWVSASAFIAVGQINIMSRDYNNAQENITNGLNIAKEIGQKNLIITAYRELSRLFAARGDYEKALEQYKRFHQMDKEILNETSRIHFNELQASYEAEKRTKEIEMLKKNNEIQDLTLGKAKIARNAFIGGFFLVLIILTMLFKKYLYLFSFWKKQKYVGQFRLMEKIGSGSTGTIYKAHRIVDKSEIAAVKILKEELFTDENIKKRFQREAAIIDQLDHPHIIKIIERGETKQTLYTAMEFLEGKTLESRINEAEPLTIEQCVHIMLQISDALAFIHAKDIIHRDLKPDNIMLIKNNGDPPFIIASQKRAKKQASGMMSPTQEKDWPCKRVGAPPHFIKLLDFGLARMEFQTRLTQSGSFVGTLEYMSPEQILETDSSRANDIFSLGVTFYKVLCKQTPFTGETPIDIMRKIINETPKDASEIRPGIPQELNGLVMSMMYKKPEQRPSIKAILNTLKSLKV